MAMVDLSLQSSSKVPVSLIEIAERQDISVSYLEQLFGKLRRAGLVTSVRGPGGGYVITHKLEETRIADIILAVDEPIRVTRCTPGSPEGCNLDKSRCLTHDLWEELTTHIHTYLSSVTLKDIIEKRILGSSTKVYKVRINNALDAENLFSTNNPLI